MREYAVDPLQALFIREVMRPNPRVVPPSASAVRTRDALERDAVSRRQRLYPVVDPELGMFGAVGWSHLAEATDGQPVSGLMRHDVAVAHPDEVLRTVATRMAEHQVGALPEFELLGGRRRQLEEERERERPLRLPPVRASRRRARRDV
ncbi:MAG TPA: CBS domain-containing protein [Gaiellaceae bacterium]|nr:CBS domain-containing protein [Gaiellaceae bacterium]